MMHEARTGSDHAKEYAALRERVIGIVTLADRSAPCPLTPAWTVGDTLAHLVGVTADILDDRLDGVASDAWTDAQVQARATSSIDAMVAEWIGTAEAFDARVAALPTQVSGQIVFDAVTHEHDLRHALGVPGARDVEAVSIAADWIGTMAGMGKVSMDPGIRLVVGAQEYHWGVESSAAVTLTPFEFVRTTSGRRSAAQILATGFPSLELGLAAGIFRPASVDVVE